MATISERDRCLEIERGISRLLLAPSDGTKSCAEECPSFIETSVPAAQALKVEGLNLSSPPKETFKPLPRPQKVRKRDRKKNAERSLPTESLNRAANLAAQSGTEHEGDDLGEASEVQKDFAEIRNGDPSVECGKGMEVTRDSDIDTKSTLGKKMDGQPESGSDTVDLAPSGSGQFEKLDTRRQREKESRKEKQRNKTLPADQPDRAKRQGGRGKKANVPNKKQQAGSTEPKTGLHNTKERENRIPRHPGSTAQPSGNNDSATVCDMPEIPAVMDTHFLLKNKKVLYLNDLERDLLSSMAPGQLDTGSTLGNDGNHTSQAPARQQESNPGNKDTERDTGFEGAQMELNALLAEKIEVFKTHHIELLKKKSARFPRACFYCQLCRRHLDDHFYVEKHMEHDDHVMRKKVKDMRLEIKNLPYPVDVQTIAITNLIEEVAARHSLSSADVEWRKEIVNDLESFLAEAIPDVKLALYGSSLSGFGLKDSNINVELVFSKEDNCANVLMAASKALSKNVECTTLMKKFEDRVPRIQFNDRKSNLTCELCVNNSNSQKTTKLLADYASLDPRVKTLGVAFRQWAWVCALDSQDRGTLPPHAYPIMTVYFLQQCKPPVLPVLHEMKKTEDTDSYVSPQELRKDGSWTCQNDRTIGQLWVELLRFYSVEFKLNKRAVCIRRSKPLLHAEKKWNKRYIGIEDPYSRKRNLARSIPSEQMFLFLKRCLRTSAVYFHVPQLVRGPMFTSLPGPLLYNDDSEWEDDNDDSEQSGQNDSRKKSTNQNAGNKGNDEHDEDDDDDEDDASSTSSGVPDLDEQDHDLNFDEVAKVIVDMDLGEDLKVESKKAVKSGSKKEHAEKTVQFVKPGPSIPDSLREELEKLVPEDFVYEFNRRVLAGGKSPPLVCLYCQKKGHLQHNCPEQQLPRLKELPAMTRSFMNILNNICFDVLDMISPRPHEEQTRQKLLSELEAFIQELHKDAKLSLFGSSCNGFGLIRSDLDICLTFESSKDGKELNHEQMIVELAKKLSTHPDLQGIIAITTAKVPIVKFVHKPSMLEGDISLYNMLAQHNTRLLKVYSDIDDRVKVLGYTFKHFAKVCDIGDASRGSLSSYAYILMTLYYLQQCQPPVIPVLQELYEEGQTKPEVMVDNWNAWFYDAINNLQTVWKEFGQNNECVGELWLGMLRFYTEEFNFKERVICIRQKQPLTRLQKMWTSKSIAIEDPFDLDHNLGSGVSRKMYTYIMKAFIKGRAMCGTPLKRLPNSYPDYMSFFFDRHQLTDGHPPNDRGCRACGKIGHRVKDCPKRRCPRGAAANQDEPQRRSFVERITAYVPRIQTQRSRRMLPGDNKRRRTPGQRGGDEFNDDGEMLGRNEDSECGRSGTLNPDVTGRMLIEQDVFEQRGSRVDDALDAKMGVGTSSGDESVLSVQLGTRDSIAAPPDFQRQASFNGSATELGNVLGSSGTSGSCRAVESDLSWELDDGSERNSSNSKNDVDCWVVQTSTPKSENQDEESCEIGRIGTCSKGDTARECWDILSKSDNLNVSPLEASFCQSGPEAHLGEKCMPWLDTGSNETGTVEAVQEGIEKEVPWMSVTGQNKGTVTAMLATESTPRFECEPCQNWRSRLRQVSGDHTVVQETQPKFPNISIHSTLKHNIHDNVQNGQTTTSETKKSNETQQLELPQINCANVRQISRPKFQTFPLPQRGGVSVISAPFMPAQPRPTRKGGRGRSKPAQNLTSTLPRVGSEHEKVDQVNERANPTPSRDSPQEMARRRFLDKTLLLQQMKAVIRQDSSCRISHM